MSTVHDAKEDSCAGFDVLASPTWILWLKLDGTVEQTQDQGIHAEQQAPKRAQANVGTYQLIGLPSHPVY